MKQKIIDFFSRMKNDEHRVFEITMFSISSVLSVCVLVGVIAPADILPAAQMPRTFSAIFSVRQERMCLLFAANLLYTIQTKKTEVRFYISENFFRRFRS